MADVVLIASDLASFPRASMDAIIDDVYSQLSTDTWGTRRDLGAKYLAAHVATITARTALGAGGPVTQEKVGEVARLYLAKMDDALLETTPYGKEYKRLVRGLANARGPFVLGGDSTWSSTGGFGRSRGFFP